MFFPSQAQPIGFWGAANNAVPASSTDDVNGFTGHHVVDNLPQNPNSRIPIWAIVLVVLGAILVLLFILGFVHHGIQESRLASDENRKVNIRKIFVKAIKVALFVWVFALIAKCLCGRRSKTASGATTSYRKVDDAGGEIAANNNMYTTSLGYGMAQPGLSGAAYGDGGSGNMDATSEKYEPLGYYPSSEAKAMATGKYPDDYSRSRSASTSAPFSPKSAFVFHQDTSYPPANVAPLAPGPRHITPSGSPVPSPLPTPAIVTEPLMTHASSTYIPGRDSQPMF